MGHVIRRKEKSNSDGCVLNRKQKCQFRRVMTLEVNKKMSLDCNVIDRKQELRMCKLL